MTTTRDGLGQPIPVGACVAAAVEEGAGSRRPRLSFYRVVEVHGDELRVEVLESRPGSVYRRTWLRHLDLVVVVLDPATCAARYAGWRDPVPTGTWRTET